MSKPVTNVAASVRQRLLNLARDRKEDFDFTKARESFRPRPPVPPAER